MDNTLVLLGVTLGCMIVVLALRSMTSALNLHLFLTFLFEHLAAAAKLNLPLEPALAACSQGLAGESLKVVRSIREQMAAGALLGDALALAPYGGGGSLGATAALLVSTLPGELDARIVTEAEAEVLRVGEMTGSLSHALQSVLSERRKARSMRDWSAHISTYVPAVLLMASGVATLVVRLADELSVEIPTVSGWIFRAGPRSFQTLALLALVVPFLVRVARLRRPRTRGAHPLRGRLQRLVYHLPAFRSVLRRSALAELCRELAMLVRVRTPLPRALDVLADGTLNPCVRDRVRGAADMCRQGYALSVALEAAALDQGLSRAVQTAGDPEQLALVLDRLADDYMAGLSALHIVVSRLVGPITIVFLGIAIALVAIGIFGLQLRMMDALW